MVYAFAGEVFCAKVCCWRLFILVLKEALGYGSLQFVLGEVKDPTRKGVKGIVDPSRPQIMFGVSKLSCLL